MGVEALVDDDAVQLATAGTTSPAGVGGALVDRHDAGQARRGRRWAHLVVTVPVASLTQQRGGLSPQQTLEVRRRRLTERLVDDRFEQLLTMAEESFVEATGVAPPGQRLRGHRQLPVHDLPWSRSMAPSTDSGTGASGATMRSGSGPGSARTSVGGRCR